MLDYTEHPLVKQFNPHRVKAWSDSGALVDKDGNPAKVTFPEGFGEDRPEHRRVVEEDPFLHGVVNTLGGLVRDCQDHEDGTCSVLPHVPLDFVEIDVLDDAHLDMPDVSHFSVDMAKPGEDKTAIQEMITDMQGNPAYSKHIILDFPSDVVPATRRFLIWHEGRYTPPVVFTDEALAAVGDGFQIFTSEIYLDADDTDLFPATAFGKVRDSRKNAIAAAQRKSKKRAMRGCYVLVIHAGALAAVYCEGEALSTWKEE